MVKVTQFGGRRKCRLIGALGEVWWAMAQQGTCASSPECARDGELPAAAFLARGARQSESGRVHSARGVAVDVMRALGADERGHHRCTNDIWWTGVDRNIHAGELSSESKCAIAD